ncbi:hypothetical protein SAMD00019534_005760 [Acytostelium subglobosum LB1]|uniref:hypothetical protein n=1 Tax=Acytostelium subglobosum LB1 TaxID=1410327 RepID=UPI000644A6CD|nr:hypothetical protein SAMD00019534_005760 [Acytostelium subglobosum LB1]GAM17401.1 hypothetical protein SAMD00019534_005760 [Acytostelium subglobosum LB1]|eukprot:XP_012759463.1 hypothetical protein SAMD00019534_005760 [Acytostelium subglobosum LB1]
MFATKTRKAVLAAIIIVLLAISIGLIVYFTTRDRNDSDPSAVVYTDMLLPTWVTPTNYLLHVNTYLNNFTFTGAVVITVNITQKKDFVVLHGENLNITSIFLAPTTAADAATYPTSSQVPAGAHEPLRVTYNANNTYYVIQFKELPELLEKGSLFNIYLQYNANLTDGLKGYYRSKYYDPGEKYLALTKMEPTYARLAFPCFDEPAMKAIWTIWCDIDSAYTAISNMPEQARNASAPGRTLVMFQSTPKMSSYLVAFVVSQLTYSEHLIAATGRNIEIRVWSSNALASAREYPLDIAVNATKFYTQYFGIEYALPKLDLVGVADFASGAMENWGCITFREVLLFYNETTANVNDKQSVAEVVSHEIAHQWFGNLVTMKWWNDLWLNEGFATFMAYQAMASICPEFNTPSDFLIDIKSSGLQMDSSSSTHPISNNYVTVVDIIASFDSITYNKGASVLGMLNAMLNNGTTNQFKLGIQSYLKKFSYGNAQTSDLWDALTAATGGTVNVSNIMSAWVNKPGLPMVSVSRNGDTLTLAQSRYINDINAKPNDTTVWQVPITIQTNCTTSASNNDDILFSQTSTTINVPNCVFTMLNADSTGFYRTHYDDALFKQIGNELANVNTVISSQAAIAFLDDTFSFVQSGQVQPSSALEMIRFLNITNQINDNQIYVWRAAMSGTSYIGQRMSDQMCYPQYSAYIQSLATTLVNNVNNIYTTNISNTYQQQLIAKYAISIGNSAGVSNVTQHLHNVWVQNMNTPQFIDVNVRRTVYQSIVSNGDYQEYNWVLGRYLNTATSINERADALSALGFPKESYLIQQSLNLMGNGTIRIQDQKTLTSSLAANQEALDRTWEYVQEHWDIFPSRFQPELLMTLANNYDSPIAYKQFKQFMSDKTYLPQTSVDYVLETIQNNINWKTINTGPLCDYLFGLSNNQSLSKQY